MRRQLSQAEVERLFMGAVDGALEAGDAAAFDEALAGDAELRERFGRYQRAVGLLGASPRERAPEALATTIMRRTRRRRVNLRRREAQAYRFPAEIVIPLLMAALVALFMVVASP